jgi:pyruvate, orthophosphate dikinase
MVFGNMGEDCATGVGFTRNPATGKKEFYGEYLINAQGEDVVSGVRTPKVITNLKNDMPKVYKQLVEVTTRLEKHYKDMQDFEFTIENDILYMLQTRSGKRSIRAGIKIAVEMVKEKLITINEALMRIDPNQINQLLHPIVDPKAKLEIIAKGLPASPGAGTGKVVFDPDEAVAMTEAGEKVILVRDETSPDDINGMNVAQGILTARGGMTSHAAVVARGMGKCSVVGCEDIKIDMAKKCFSADNNGNKYIIKEGDYITIDGNSGNVILGKADTIMPEIEGEFRTFMK